MNGLTILMFIFALGIFLCGLYLFTGHKSELLLWKNHNVKDMSLEEVKNVGKWTMISSIIPIIIGIIGFFIEV